MNLNLYTSDEKTRCEFCLSHLKNSFLLGRLPLATINNTKHNSQYKDEKLILNLCNFCKNISLSKFCSYNFYKNFVNNQKQSNHLNLIIRNQLKKTNVKKINVLNFGKLKFDLNVKLKKKTSLINIDIRKNISNKNYYSLKKIKKKFDIIFVENFLANLNNIEGYIKIFFHILKPNGKFFFISHYGLNIIERLQLGKIYHEHFNYFSITSLLILFRRCNLFCNKIKYSNKGFFIEFVKNKKNIDSNLRKILEREKKFNFQNLKLFSLRLLKNKIRINNFLRKIKKKGQIEIVGYGASIGSQTKIKYYNIGKYLDYLIDDNPIAKEMIFKNYSIKIKKTSSKGLFSKNKKKVLIVLIPDHFQNIKKFINKKINKNDHLLML